MQFLPQLASPHRNIAITLSMEKLEWCDYPTVKKTKDMFIRFDEINIPDRQSEGHRASIGRVYAYHRAAKN